MSRPLISTIIICKDNEGYIRECIESVQWTDEIIAVDSGSSDRTVEILQEKGAKTCFKEWQGYRKQKEYAMSLTSNDWVLEIDTDERLSDEIIGEIENIPPADWERYTCFEMPRLTFLLGRPIKGCGWHPDYKGRLYNKRSGHWVGLRVHEHFHTDGKKKRLSGKLLHMPPWDVSAFIKRTVEYAVINARDYRELGRKAGVTDLTLRPLYAFLYKYLVRKGFIDGWPGFLICLTESFGVFVKYYELFRLNSK